MNIKKHIPNFLTCCNLLCGLIGILTVMYGIAGSTLHFDSISWIMPTVFLIFLAGVFDFLDGFAARLLNVSSPIGKQLDSMADMVSFGVLPGMIMFAMIAYPRSEFENDLLNNFFIEFRPLLAFLIPIFSALRLAKFNIDTRQSDSFIGMPTPANTLFIAGLAYIYGQENNILSFLVSPISLIVLCFLLSYLLVAELPLLALKFKNFGWPDNKMRYILIISSVVLFAILNFTSIPIIIILYIILSLIENYIKKAKVA
jgi:CDP-diacylglycerol--serine O-phosphatidyltransferase